MAVVPTDKEMVQYCLVTCTVMEMKTLYLIVVGVCSVSPLPVLIITMTWD